MGFEIKGSINLVAGKGKLKSAVFFQEENEMQTELDKIMAEMNAEFAVLKEKYQKKLDSVQDGEGWPKEGGKYWYIDECGFMKEDTYEEVNNLDSPHGWRWMSGNCFRTKQETEIAGEKIKVRTKLERLADGGYFEIYFDEDGKILIRKESIGVIGSFRFSSDQKARHAIDAIGVDRLNKFAGMSS